MSVSETELEKRVLEAGENLLDQPPPSSIRRLLELLDLDEVFGCLSEVEQNPPTSMKNALSPSIKALAAAELFKHSDIDVKVAVAACITEIMRITAPDAPYDDEKMKEVFQLLVSSFEHLSDMCSCSYPKRISILETVSELKFVTVMLDLECYARVIEMFQHFLKFIRDHHPMEVFLYMENIMTQALDERDDIPPELLSPILHYVKKDDKIPQVSQRLGEQVLSRCGSKLKTCLTKAVQASGVSLDMYSNVVASICEGTFSALNQNIVVANPGHLFSSAQDLPSKKTSVPENKCAAEEDHREESHPMKKKKEISTKKTKPSATTSATIPASEEINTTTEATLRKKSRKVASSSRVKPTGPPMKRKTSEKKAVEMIWCKKPRSQQRKKKSQDVERPQMRSHYQLLEGDNKKAFDLQNYDEKLVGSRIRVWWPLDKAYYEAVVYSYDSSKRRHLVHYDDGEQEILNLQKQKWYFVDESELSELDQEANQTGRDEEASTMPPKKKAKTGKAQSAIPPYVKKDDKVPQASPTVKEQILMVLQPYGKVEEVSTPEQPCVDAATSSKNENGHEVVSPRRETVAGVKTPERTHEMVELPVAEEEDHVEVETGTHKRARVESCSLHEAHDEMEKTIAAEGEHSCHTHKSSAEPEHWQQKRVLQPCSVSDQLAKVKQSIVDTITSVRQFRFELETKEQSIVDILTSVRQFQSEIKKKEDNLEASLQEVDILGEKILGINKTLNS
ncbi:hypothetical protein AALP_AA7G173100 [Arabis alpina]|uniref:Tudor domain-containing protein n=1 Tax=Arabis alpina TaxID=50452 RepID=A0A087GIP1_ARAAL|nr:hypothetical protein AALP_AA7G173100 [Arabis alpina]